MRLDIRVGEPISSWNLRMLNAKNHDNEAIFKKEYVNVTQEVRSFQAMLREKSEEALQQISAELATNPNETLQSELSQLKFDISTSNDAIEKTLLNYQRDYYFTVGDVTGREGSAQESYFE